MKKKVLMIGAGRDVRGGVSSVVNGYYDAGMDKKINLVYLPTMKDGSKIKKLKVAMEATLKFNRLIKEGDVLHVHMSSDASFFRKAIFIKKAKELDKKIIIHMHGSTFDKFYLERCSDKAKEMVRAVFAMADYVIALSDYWRDFLGENICDPSKITLIYNGVVIPKMPETPRSYTDKNILFMGLMGERKGTFDLLNAFAKVLESHPDAKLHLCGDGDVDRVKELISQLSIDDKVFIHGWVVGEDKKELLKSCSLYCLPSYNEGMPMSVLEAMSEGLCTISTDIGGIPHIIRDRENGRLLKPGDIDGLALSVNELLRDHSLKMRYGSEGRKTIEDKFDLNVLIDKVIELY